MPIPSGNPRLWANRPIPSVCGSTGWRSRELVAVIRALCLAATFAACGCAHNKANQYTYAPPLAPPVYPQPQTAAQPVAYPAPPPGAVPMMAAPAYAPAGTMPPAAAAPAMPMSAEVPALPDGSCPPCATGGVVPAMHEDAVQTMPCPPGQ